MKQIPTIILFRTFTDILEFIVKNRQFNSIFIENAAYSILIEICEQFRIRNEMEYYANTKFVEKLRFDKTKIGDKLRVLELVEKHFPENIGMFKALMKERKNESF